VHAPNEIVKQSSRRPISFPWGQGGVWAEKIYYFCVPSAFPLVLNDVPQVLNGVPNRTIWGEALHLHIETSIIGEVSKVLV
jgi:hypothetical protein